MPKLKLNDTEFELTVVKYKQEAYNEWSEIRVSVKNRYMNFADSGEILQRAEIDDVICALNDLIYDKIDKVTELEFTEPDLTMQLYPARLEFSSDKCIYRTGHGTTECCLDIAIHFRNADGIYVDEMYIITLNRDQITELLDGLETECGKRKKKRELIGLVGVSFLGKPRDIYWYRYDGKLLWSQEFVTVMHNGKVEYGEVEYRRSYDRKHLPCAEKDLTDIISIVYRGGEKLELSEKWSAAECNKQK